jgi:UDP-GlcNAc3NAcA epimerase
MKIATIIGARPQFVKASIVSHTLRKYSQAEEFLVHTGQHYDVSMSDIFFSQLSMKDPRYNLNISGSTHGDMTGRMIISIEQVLLKEKPDVVLVYGDTNSTLAAAIAASKLMIPIAHVEAGLRSFNMSMPEEINRILTDRVSDLLFTPSESADQNLLMEGVPKNKIIRSGDVMLDVLLKVTSESDNKEIVPLLSESKSYVLATVHRQENTDNIESWNKIIGFINDISQQSKVIWPVHPRVSSKIPRSMMGNKNIELVEPLGYLEMLHAVMNSKFVITDSGGLQKEAFFLGIPCITLRTETEWSELLEIGWNKLLPPKDINAESVQSAFEFQPSSAVPAVYGDGHASEVIVKKLLNL